MMITDGFNDEAENAAETDPLNVNEFPGYLDSDGDGYIGTGDNCPEIPNPNQLDFDNDGRWEEHCSSEDDDDDNDNIKDTMDDCPKGSTGWNSKFSTDYDGDGCKDSSADTDDDGDNVADSSDAFPLDSTEWNEMNGQIMMLMALVTIQTQMMIMMAL